jgi:hypothetical protein
MPAFGATSHDVLPVVRRAAEHTTALTDTSWNTYDCHPRTYCLDDVSVDYWGAGGRGFRLTNRQSRDVAAVVIRMQQKWAVKYMLTDGRIWTPFSGWHAYGAHGRSHSGHVHVTYDYYSRVAGMYPPWP